LESLEATANPRTIITSQFISPTFCIRVGPAKTEYHLHKEILISKSLYFKNLLSSTFKGVEEASGVLTLDSHVDTDDAFQMFVEYIYLSDYDPPSPDRDGKCLLHARVYVLAERLCMEDLKSLALKRIGSELLVLPRIGTKTVVRMVKVVYDNTPNLYPPPDFQPDPQLDYEPIESTGNSSSKASPVDEPSSDSPDYFFNSKIAEPPNPGK
jgi:hypothetical protein